MSVKQPPTPLVAAEELERLIKAHGGTRDADLLLKLIEVVLGSRPLDRADYKLLYRSVRDLTTAFKLFDRYRGIRKVTVYGSARVPQDSPYSELARRFARRIADAGFMVLTGAGRGIMQAAQEGAGRARSFGLNIVLPFEQEPNETISDDSKLLFFQYFFTRKLIFVEETDAFALFPGGFGTHDEAFEILTLLQTGKSTLMPVVLLEPPGGAYWRDWLGFIQRQLVEQGLISNEDLHLFTITTDVDEAVEEITSFYRNYHSQRSVGERLVIRLQRPPSEELLGRLNREFRDLLTTGDIVATGPIGGDASEVPALPRLALWFDYSKYGRLRQMLDVLNDAER